MRRGLAGVVLALWLCSVPGLASVAMSIRVDKTIDVAAAGNEAVLNANEGGISVVPTVDPAVTTSIPTFVERRVPVVMCGTESDPSDTGAPCIDGVETFARSRVCADGSDALPPLWRRAVDPATGLGVGPWVRIDDGYCPQDDAAVVLTSEEFRRLPLAASVPTFQPAGGRALVNKDLIVFADPAPQELSTVILGTPVQVRATPVEFVWDFGDGSAPLVTTDPGRPYPDYSVAHLYASRGTFEVQLVTTWQGVYQVAGAGPWLAVAGTAQTTSATYAVGIEEARTYLVQGSQG